MHAAAFRRQVASFGTDGEKTCALKPNSSRGGKPQKITKLTAANADDRTKFSAQNCLNVSFSEHGVPIGIFWKGYVGIPKRLLNCL